jgi:hypothetical protein
VCWPKDSRFQDMNARSRASLRSHCKPRLLQPQRSWTFPRPIITTSCRFSLTRSPSKRPLTIDLCRETISAFPLIWDRASLPFLQRANRGQKFFKWLFKRLAMLRIRYRVKMMKKVETVIIKIRCIR